MASSLGSTNSTTLVYSQAETDTLLGAKADLASPTFTGTVVAPTLSGSAASGGGLTLRSTTHATKGSILFGTSAYDEVNNRLGIGVAAPLVTLDVGGVLSVRGNALRFGSTATDNAHRIEYNGTVDGLQYVGFNGHRWLIASSERMRLTNTPNLGVGTASPHSTIHSNGSLAAAIVPKTAAYTVTASDFLINCTSGTYNVTLPTAASIAGRIYVIKNSGTGAITVATTSSQTIDGSTTYSLGTQYKYVVVMSDGANWVIMGNN